MLGGPSPSHSPVPAGPLGVVFSRRTSAGNSPCPAAEASCRRADTQAGREGCPRRAPATTSDQMHLRRWKPRFRHNYPGRGHIKNSRACHSGEVADRRLSIGAVFNMLSLHDPLEASSCAARGGGVAGSPPPRPSQADDGTVSPRWWRAGIVLCLFPGVEPKRNSSVPSRVGTLSLGKPVLSTPP